MSRALAFLCFVAAAFGWPEWFVDRAGLAALGFAFTALALGGLARPRAGVLAPRAGGWRLKYDPAVPPVLRDLGAGEVDDSP